jgi:hypothetical protein
MNDRTIYAPYSFDINIYCRCLCNGSEMNQELQRIRMLAEFNFNNMYDYSNQNIVNALLTVIEKQSLNLKVWESRPSLSKDPIVKRDIRRTLAETDKLLKEIK